MKLGSGMNFLNSLKSVLPQKTGKQAGQPVVQSWLSVQNVLSGGIQLRDGSLVGVIRVEPVAFGLLSPEEKNRRIIGLHEAIQSFSGAMQLCAIPRPINLDVYISELEGQLVETDGSRKAVLRGYLQYVRALVASAQAMERRFYLLMPTSEYMKGARGEVVQRMSELIVALSRAELQAHICSEEEILDLLFCFFHPVQSAFERPAFPTVAPIYYI